MRPDMKTLKSAAQRFCDESMEPPAGPLTSKNGYYCGWSSMSSTLEKNRLVDRHKGRPHTFTLTPEGREVAFKVVQEHPEDFGVSNAFNSTAHSDANSGGGAGSSSPDAFSPPRRTGAEAAAAGTRGVPSSVRNPYSPSGWIAAAFPSSSSGGGCGGGGSSGGGRGGVSTASALAANAAEARRSVEVASKAKVKAPAAATASVGTTRGRMLQRKYVMQRIVGMDLGSKGSGRGRGQEKHAKRAKLYEMSSPGPPRHGDRGGTSGMLLAALQQCGQQGDGKSAASREKSEPPPPASTAAARGAGELGAIDDDWMSLTSKPVSSPPALEVSSPPAAWNRRASGGRPNTTSPEPSSVGAVSRRAAPPPPPSRSAVPSAGGNKRKTATSSETGGRGGGVTMVEDVVDISLSDDEDEGDGSDGAEAVAVSSPDRAQAPTELPRSSSSSSSSAEGSAVSPSVTQPRAGGGGGAAIRVGQDHHAAAAVAAGVGAPGPGGGGVAPLVPPTLYRSMARGAAAGPSEDGALSWRGRACPAWLQGELDAGALSGKGCPPACSRRSTPAPAGRVFAPLSDRMVDAFDLVLIVDPGEQRDKVRAPIRDKLER
ncbi:unnamed protein product [Ectocarpus sp. CCAP 1310/34]|nr:unnamed protein product [Ectocarpus sp. CCAP 1310/34]